MTANGLDMLTEIRRERSVELAFEGFRRNDLRRWKIAEDVMPMAIRGVKFEGAEYEAQYPDLQIGADVIVDAEGFVVAESADSRQFLAPPLPGSNTVTADPVIAGNFAAESRMVGNPID